MSLRRTWMAAGMAMLFGAGVASAQSEDAGMADTGAIQSAKSSQSIETTKSATAGETGATPKHKKTRAKKKTHKTTKKTTSETSTGERDAGQ